MKATSVGANIRGNPPMATAAVRHDLNVIRKKADVAMLQEFSWLRYWRLLAKLLITWGSYPGKGRGTAKPIEGAQAVLFRRKMFELIDSKSWKAFDFNMKHAGIMDNRWIRAALLRAKPDGFTHWALSTHFAVGADKNADPPLRKNLLSSNLSQLDEALTWLKATGYPIMGEFDGNIHMHTWAYRELMRILEKHGAVIHGTHGVEYMFTINGPRGKFTSTHASIFPTSKLKTDHEYRLLDWTGIPLPF